MQRTFLGFDHVDTRVASLAAVEAFYDRLMPELGLVEKSHSFVDATGEWENVSAEHAYNVVEYSESIRAGEPRRFIGFIEDPGMVPVKTRIAFAAAGAEDVLAWKTRLEELGARAVEVADDFASYPAVFFEDPAGTRLEICARLTRASTASDLAVDAVA